MFYDIICVGSGPFYQKNYPFWCTMIIWFYCCL